ncbi:MAG: NAD-dependent epimerase/dehydratase family protein [Burkholderiaceae bacterium]
MKLFVTGVEGYIGSLLAPLLIERGHEVVGLDTGYYRDGWLYSEPSKMARFPTILDKDLRKITEADLEGCDAVLHLAELSNDPLGQNKPEVTHEINHRGSVNLAAKAKAMGIERFVYTSSCSVYGLGSGEFLSESDPVNPQTAYAECKVLVERDVGKMAADDFSPVFLRNATAYGASPRLRFDIVLNNLAGHAWTTKKIAMTSDGTPWRPLVHVLDICKAIVCAAEAPRDAIHNQVFNVGHSEDNYRVREIAEIVGEEFTGCEVTIGTSAGDNRSYRVNCDKIHTRLPGFSCDWNARKGAAQLRDLFERVEMDEATFNWRPYTRLKQLQYLIRTQQLDSDFYWKY